MGFKLGDICADTENITIDPGIISKMNEIGLDEEYFNRNSEGDYYIDSPDEMVKLWVGILNYIDPELNLTINKNNPSITFYGFDEQGRHIDYIGYGLFD